MKNNIPGGYYFPYWGPFILKTKVSRPDLIRMSRFIDKKHQKKSAREMLAGVIDKEFYISSVDLMKDLQPYINLYREVCFTYYKRRIDNVDCISSWINLMKAGEVNPQHVHSGDCTLSCVLYLKVSKELKKENADYDGTSAGPGGITFFYGEPREHSITQYSLFPEERDLLIFPSNVRHEVLPFKSKGQRISIAANFK
jgi:hypothetical protein